MRNRSNIKILVTIANYGSDQLGYLRRQVQSFQEMRYTIDIVVCTSISVGIEGIEEVLFQSAPDNDWNNLPWECRKIIYERKEKYDLFLYSDNDHLYKEYHIDLFLDAVEILPENRIMGFMQFEEYPEKGMGNFYPAWHAGYGWKGTTEEYAGQRFAQFTNPHHAGFLLTQTQLMRLSDHSSFSLQQDGNTRRFNVKVRAASDVYLTELFEKVIWIDRFEESLLHHMPNKYLNLENGHFDWKSNQNFDKNSMTPALDRLRSQENPFSIIIPTMWKCPVLLQIMLTKYENSPLVREVLLINNHEEGRMDTSMFGKVRILGDGHNMYVNPAWNLGVSMALCENIVLANDDIVIQDVHFLLSMVLREITSGVIFGPDESCFPQRGLKPSIPGIGNVRRNKWSYGFGVFMVMQKSSYHPIPSNIKVWCGDNLQWRRNAPRYFVGIPVYTKMQSTSSTLNLQQIRRSDEINYKKYLYGTK